MLLITSLTGCGFFSSMFNKDTVEDTALLDEQTSKNKWFCYGSQEGKAWECENAPDESKISAIKPKSRTNNTTTSGTTQSVSERSSVIRSDSEISDVSATQTNSVTQVTSNSAVTSLPTTNGDLAKPTTTVQNQTQLLAAPREHYAVQLLALKREADLLEYAKLNGISEPLHMQIASGGSNWYVLLLGVYADKNSAEIAMADWEKTKTLKIRPWIRQLGQLQDAMRAAQGG